MLPMLAMIVAGYMAKRQGAGQRSSMGGGIGDLLGSLGGSQAGRAGGGLSSMLDQDGNGNPLDDILRMAGRRGPH